MPDPITVFVGALWFIGAIALTTCPGSAGVGLCRAAKRGERD
jgi:hypothetical protein